MLFWDYPQAKQVWIAQHTAGVWCPGGETILKPDAIYGPLPPTGIQRVIIPPNQNASIWFDLYTDTPVSDDCTSYPSSTSRADVEILHVLPTATPFPDEYFLIDDLPPRSIDSQGVQSYETALGEFILLTWSQPQSPVYLAVQKSQTDEPVIYGPLPRTSALKVCPSSGTIYTLYAGGKPGEVEGKSISIHQSPSTFQQWPSTFVPCWDYPN